VQVLAECRVGLHLIQVTVSVARFVTWVDNLLLVGRLTSSVEDVLGADDGVRGLVEDLARALLGRGAEMEAGTELDLVRVGIEGAGRDHPRVPCLAHPESAVFEPLDVGPDALHVGGVAEGSTDFGHRCRVAVLGGCVDCLHL
jgi:hypothetical protein